MKTCILCGEKRRAKGNARCPHGVSKTSCRECGKTLIKSELEKMNIAHEHNKTYELSYINLLRWDFRIEHNGKQYFIEYMPTLYQKIKADYCKTNGYVLLVIHCNHYGNIPAILSDFAYTHLGWGVGE
jgi:hypothetical protein